MAEIRVRQGAGGEGGTLPTLAAAAALARPGDTVIVHEGTYPAFAAPAGTRWQAAEGEVVVIDGGWNGKRQPGDTEKTFQPGVKLEAGAVVDGFTIRRAKGAGAVLGDGAVIMFCRILEPYDNGIHLWKVKGAEVIACVIREANKRFTVGGHPGGASVSIIDSTGCVVSGCDIGYGYGEGIDVGRGSEDSTVTGNIIFDHKHVMLYIVRSRRGRIANNVIFHTGHPTFLTRNNRHPGGISVGDEGTKKMQTFGPSAANVIEGNLVVNCGSAFSVRNNNPATHKDGTIYDTMIDRETVIRGNTFVAGPGTYGHLVDVQPNYVKRPHQAAVFERNVVIGGTVDLPAAFRYGGNAWQPAAPTHARTPADVPVELARPQGAVRALLSVYPEGTHNLHPADFAPVAGSPLATAGYGAVRLDGPEPPVEPPPDPEPEPEPLPVDWAALGELAAEGRVKVAAAIEALDAAVRTQQVLENRIREYELAALGGEE